MSYTNLGLPILNIRYNRYTLDKYIWNALCSVVRLFSMTFALFVDNVKVLYPSKINTRMVFLDVCVTNIMANNDSEH